jgi:hypothetical protein
MLYVSDPCVGIRRLVVFDMSIRFMRKSIRFMRVLSDMSIRFLRDMSIRFMRMSIRFIRVLSAAAPAAAVPDIAAGGVAICAQGIVCVCVLCVCVCVCVCVCTHMHIYMHIYIL